MKYEVHEMDYLDIVWKHTLQICPNIWCKVTFQHIDWPSVKFLFISHMSTVSGHSYGSIYT